MTNEHLISVGMPAYNGERFIRKALESILAQEHGNFELIISDNASTDNTLKICKEYASHDKRIRINAEEHNKGIPANFEKVLQLATGKYFMWAAVDDYWHPSFIRELLKELEKHPEAGVAMSAVDCISEDQNSFYTISFPGTKDPNRFGYLGMTLKLASLLKYNLFISGIFRTELLKNISPLLAGIPSSDRWLLLQIALAGRFRYIDKPLHTRIIRNEELHQRYPEEEYSRKRKIFDRKWFDFEPIPVVAKIIYNSPIIPPHRKLYIPIILLFIFYYRLKLGILRMSKSLILRYCPRFIQKRLIKSIN
jgi:glycosyltransferase involved in cell wall biosynthesis